MANLKEIRTRITSVESTMQITSAMKMVSAAKLKRAQDAITQMRPFAKKFNEILLNVSGSVEGGDHPLMKKNNGKKVLLIALSSNRGLCGGFNSNVIKEVKRVIKENSPAGTVIGSLIVEDPDSGDKYKFGIARDSRDDFAVQGLNLVSKRSFNYEEEQNFSVSIQVTDSGSESLVGQVFVEVENRNEKPRLMGEKKTSFSHAENLGKIVGRLLVEDPDKNQSSVIL